MPLFRYKALTSQGKKLSGSIEATSEGEAKDRLRERGLMIANIAEEHRKTFGESFRGEPLVTFTIMLAQLVSASVPLYESLVSLEEQYRGERYHGVIVSLCDKIKGGGSLSEAMAEHPDSFDSMYCAMVAAGEAAGALGPVLEQLGNYLSRQHQMKVQMMTAMIYPGILVCFSLLVVSLLLTFVVPSIEAIFEGRDLNAFTRAVLGISHFARGYWWLYLPVIGGGAVFGYVKASSSVGQQWLQKMSLKMPLLRTVIVQAALARFCRTMATMQHGGVTIIEAMRVSRSVMKNVVLEEEMTQAEERIVQGSSLSREMGRSKWIPSMVSRMIAVGEDSGTTVRMFYKIADVYEDALAKTLDRLMALAQPAILLFMGVTIGIILLAILLPLTDVTAFATE